MIVSIDIGQFVVHNNESWRLALSFNANFRKT